jgi:aspartyl-tRNA(Asn)/glutamyl-tRNA(Gln) amidotransferase subunit B
LAANVLINKILPFLESKAISLSAFQVKTVQIIEFMDAISNGEISHTSAFQKLFPYLLENNSLSVQQIIDKLDLGLTTDDGALAKIIETILENNPDELKRYKGGKKALFGFFMGEVMKSSKGKFDPKAIKSELSKIINS